MTSETAPTQKFLLNSAIVLLIAFNGFQLYGLTATSPVKEPSAATSDAETSTRPIQINVLNGCGMNGVSSVMTEYCRSVGYDVVEMANYSSFNVDETMVIDRNGKMEPARLLAERIGIVPKNVIQQFSSEQFVAASIVIGKDYKKLIPWNK
jgi:hypothetical protein